jgi:hypothetical protein
MKIAIGINAFKPYDKLNHREMLCIESLQKLKQKFKNVELYIITFEEDQIAYDGFTTINKLKKKSNTVVKEYFKQAHLSQEYSLRENDINSNKRELPIVNEIFDVMSDIDSDYFLFTNSDIIISDRFIKHITAEYECYPSSKACISNIKSLDETPVADAYSVHGFDAFAIKNSTWKRVTKSLKQFILGHNYWDTYFFTMLNCLCKCKNLNKLPFVSFHINHDGCSSDKAFVENYYTEDVFRRDPIVNRIWWNYVFNVLEKRPTVNNCRWYQPFENEVELEQHYFKLTQ